MLHSEDHRRLEMAIRCLEALCVTAKSFWRDIMDAGGIPALLELMRSTRPALQRMAAAVVCHISERTPVCEALVRYGAVPVLVNLLGSQQAELHSRCALILADLAGHSDQYQSLIAQQVSTTDIISLSHSPSGPEQVKSLLPSFLNMLMEFLNILYSCTLSCVPWAMFRVEFSRAHCIKLFCHRKLTLCSYGTNSDSTSPFKSLKKVFSLLNVTQVFQVEAREQGAVSLWALAGHTLKQQRLMAEHIGYHFILELILSSSDRMQYVGCQAVIALSRDSRSHQDGLCKENGVPPLVRLLRGSRTTERTLLSVIRSLGILCIGGAHTNNPNSQRVIAEEQAIPTLLELVKHQESLQVKVQVAQTLACVLLGNQELQTTFWEKEEFTYETVLELLRVPDQDICLEAGYALSLFAYNNTTQQAAILQNGGIPIAMYEPFLNSRNEMERAKAAFQIVVLAKVITDTDQVTLSARGVTVLVDLLQSTNPNTVVLTAQLLASLAHTRAGIPDAIVTMGAVGHLCAHLYSEEEEVRTASSSALGYLTFNRHAHRLLLVECRNTPSMYNLLTQHLIEDAKISHIFTAEFERQKIVGLPSLSLEINGGPPVPQRNKKGLSKKTSRTPGLSVSAGHFGRTSSAPVLQLQPQRSRTANPKVRLQGEGPTHSSQPTLESLRLDKDSQWPRQKQ
uniref:Ankyrin and armadillo repeat containing n=1 Tax=Oncorhynchus kisutch TaxID=8019 RepID=A0A8C7GJE3_ONCKI